MSRLSVRFGLVVFVISLFALALWAPRRTAAVEAATASTPGPATAAQHFAEATPAPGATSAAPAARLTLSQEEFSSSKIKRTLNGEVTAQDLFKLALTNGNGNVTIRGGAGPTVKLSVTEELSIKAKVSEAEARKLLDSIRIVIAPEGHTLGVRAAVPRLPANVKSAAVNYEIQLPTAMQVETRTGNGSVAISGLGGAVRAQAGNGELKFTNLLGRLDVKGGNGQITARNVAGPVEITNGNGEVQCVHTGTLKAHTGNGTLEAAEIAGDVTLRGGNGEIKCREINGNISLEGQTGAARITQSLVLEKVRRIDAHKSTGEIVLTLNPAQPFTLEARCGTGSIDSDFPIRIEGRGASKRAGGQIGQGGPQIRLQTSTGSIRILKK